MAFKKSGGNSTGDDNIPGEDFDEISHGSGEEFVSGSEKKLNVDEITEEVTSVESEPETPKIAEVEQVDTLDAQLFANGEMELSDEPVESVDVSVASPTSEIPIEATSSADPEPSIDNQSSDKVKPRLERMIGNGNPLSPDEQRKAALAEKAAAASQGGYGGGGGGIGTLFSATGSGIKSLISGIGNGIKIAGGQKLSDRFLTPNDPVSVARRLEQQRYRGFNKALSDMEIATKERAVGVSEFNDLVEKSAPGRILSEMASAAGGNLHDYMSDVKSGKNRDPLAVKCMESLERDTTLGKVAQKIATAENAFVAAEAAAEKNFTRLASDHSAKYNIATEQNRLVDAIENAETDIKKPLPLEASLKSDDSSLESKVDTEKQHKKFMEALDKIKESIAALISKIMSKLGIGGPK